MPEPSSADVANFCEFTGAAYQIAVDYLKRYGSTDTAVSQYFETGGVLPPEIVESWDEEAFHAGRDPPYGPANQSQPGTEFNVQGADALNPSVFAPTLSRPPSRVSTYAGGNGGGGGIGTSSTGWGEPSGPQDSGVIDGAGQRFRRADREYYDTQHWAMTLPQFSMREYSQNPEPEYRARTAGTPAFLRQTSGSHYLPALITILHAIPMAREALLARDFQLPDYGADGDWWDGSSIQSSKVIVLDDPTSDSDSIELVAETQRLVAFLEQTERAYGSVQNLMQMRAVYNGENRPAADFLRAWQEAATKIQPNGQLNNVFSSTAVNDPVEAAKGQPGTAHLTEFQIPVTQQITDLGGSLYDALDEMVWPEIDGEALPSVHVQVGEILVARITRSDGSGGVGLDIPAEFYPDRYLESSIDAIRQMRSERLSLLTQIRQICSTQESLSVILNRTEPGAVSGIELIDQARSFFSATPEGMASVRITTESEPLVDIETSSNAFTYGSVAEELQQVLERIAAKHRSLEDEKAAATERLRQVTRTYREPDTHPNGSILHRYSLRGVSTDPSVTYVLANPNTTEDLLDTDIDDWQWWRLTYNQSADQPVDRQMVNLKDVLRAAKADSSEVFLVYGSDRAVKYPTQALQSRLRNFVRADNLSFSRDLQEASRRSTPTKRKASAMNEQWLEWDDVEDGRQTPVNIMVSDDEESGDLPTYDSSGRGGKSPQSWDKIAPAAVVNVDVSKDDKLLKFPDYEEVDLLGAELDEAQPEDQSEADLQTRAILSSSTAGPGTPSTTATVTNSSGPTNEIHG